MSQDGVGFGSAIEASAAGAFSNGDRRCNSLEDSELTEDLIPRLGAESEAELGGEVLLVCGDGVNDGGPHWTLCGTNGLNGTFTPVN
jgi:hypothetical protein